MKLTKKEKTINTLIEMVTMTTPVKKLQKQFSQIVKLIVVSKNEVALVSVLCIQERHEYSALKSIMKKKLSIKNHFLILYLVEVAKQL